MSQMTIPLSVRIDRAATACSGSMPLPSAVICWFYVCAVCEGSVNCLVVGS